LYSVRNVAYFLNIVCNNCSCREALLASVNSLFDAFSGDSGSSFGAADEHLPKVNVMYLFGIIEHVFYLIQSLIELHVNCTFYVMCSLKLINYYLLLL